MCLAVPMQVKEVEGLEAVVEQGGTSLRIRTDLVESLSVGDFVLVHAGFALQRVDVDEARETLDILANLGEAP